MKSKKKKHIFKSREAAKNTVQYHWQPLFQRRSPDYSSRTLVPRRRSEVPIREVPAIESLHDMAMTNCISGAEFHAAMLQCVRRLELPPVLTF
jgi:hypothetical protein